MTATSAAPTGISDNQLAALTEGGWKDISISDTPYWNRWVKVVDGDDINQFLWTSASAPHWVAYTDDEWTYVDSLEEALEWCDEQAGDREIERPSGSATKQEDRFARQTGSG